MAGVKTLGFAVDDHDPRSWELYRFIADMDYENGDLKAGGDGDNGELLLAYLDDLKTWEHAGMTCVLRHGALDVPCGYVVLPEGHPLHGVEYQDMDEWPEVHGGVTWTGELIGCPELGWLIGFDMGHFGDFGYNPCRCVRTDEECVSETERLAEQLAALAERGER